jgi:hypothetical protein
MLASGEKVEDSSVHGVVLVLLEDWVHAHETPRLCLSPFLSTNMLFGAGRAVSCFASTVACLWERLVGPSGSEMSLAGTDVVWGRPGVREHGGVGTGEANGFCPWIPRFARNCARVNLLFRSGGRDIEEMTVLSLKFRRIGDFFLFCLFFN